MQGKPAPSSNLLALPDGTELVGDYRIKRVLGAGGFGITYLADEKALARLVTIKEYFPSDLAARQETSASPRSKEVAGDYQWGLDRFIEEAQTLARFDHPNVVRVHRYFRANNTAYMVLHFEEGGSFKSWLRGLKRAPRQAELDAMLTPLLDALEMIHKADYLHRDIAPDNIMVRKDGSPVLIDFGSARGEIAAQSRTVSALVKPGYSPYEQYATNSSSQGPWTDIYALGATLYHAITGKRPPDAPSRVVSDDYVPAREAALGGYRGGFLDAIDKALKIETGERPQSIAEWRSQLFAADPKRQGGALGNLPIVRKLGQLRTSLAGPGGAAAAKPAAALAAAGDAALATAPPSIVPVPPDAPQPRGQLLDFIDALKKRTTLPVAPRKKKAAKTPSLPSPAAKPVEAAAAGLAFGLGFGAPPGEPAKPAKAEKPAKRAARAKDTPDRAAPAARKPPPKPRRTWRMPSRRWRAVIFKVGAAVAIASLAVAYQQRTTRTQAHSANVVAGEAELAHSLLLAGHKGPVAGVGIADQGRWIVSAGADATLRIWAADSGALVRTVELGEGPVTAFAVSERRALVGHNGGVAVLWDLEGAQKLGTVRLGSSAIASVAFTSEPGTIVVAARDGSVAMVEAERPATPAVALAAGHAGSQLVAAAKSRGLLAASGPEKTVRLFRVEGGSLARTYRSHAGEISALRMSDDGRYLAAAASGAVLVWTNSSSRLVSRFGAGQAPVLAMTFGPERLLATAAADGRVRVWNVRNGRLVRTLRVNMRDARASSFSGDGRFLFGTSQSGGIYVWTLSPVPVGSGT
jgi:tRNA A-37 threonylcarbamoyl transferase component Bud32